MAMRIADFCIEQVKAKGWFSIANLYFDNSYCIFPFTQAGRVCYSPSADVFFSTSTIDSVNTQHMMWYYLAEADDRHLSLYQTFTCTGGDHLQHFDSHLFNYSRQTPSGIDEFPVPTLPSEATVKGYTLDENGQYVSGGRHEEICMEDDRIISALDLYPERKSLYDYIGVQIGGYQEFIKNHEVFCKAVNKHFNLSDCI